MKRYIAELSTDIKKQLKQDLKDRRYNIPLETYCYAFAQIDGTVQSCSRGILSEIEAADFIIFLYKHIDQI